MIYVHIADGTEEIEFVTILDILRRSSIEAASVSISEQREVTGSHGIEITADLTFEEADYSSCDGIILPGGMPGTINMKNHKGLRETVIDMNRRGKLVAAVCAAPMVLASCGILEGRRACIYPGMEDRLEGAVYEDSRVVIDGNIITSKGPGTAMEFALAAAEAAGEKEKVAEVRKGLVMADV